MNSKSEDNHRYNILRTILQDAKKYADKPIIHIEERSVVYGDFMRDVAEVARWLEHKGIRPGDKIAIIFPNSVEWYTVFWATVALGARPIPLDPQIGEWELKQLYTLINFKACFIIQKYRANPVAANISNIIKGLQKKPVICIAGDQKNETSFCKWEDVITNQRLKLLPEEVKEDPEGLLMYACTSGTTGNPKIIAVDHHGFFKAQKDMAEYLELDSSDTMLLGMPLYHQGGFGMGVQAVLSCSTVIYQPKFIPVDFLKTIEKRKVTVVQLTPTLAKVLLSVPEFDSFDLSSLRLAYFAGEVLPDDLAARFYRDMGIRVVNIVGSTETATMVVWDSKYDKGCSVNDFRELEFTKVKVVDDNGSQCSTGETGRILISTDAVLREYYRNPEETGKKIMNIDGVRWFDTGDLGMSLSNSRIRFMGRKKRIIKRGSNLVFPEEIEAFLLTHPSINAIAVTKEKNEIIGELIKAYIQPAQHTTLKPGELLSFCRGKISSYKIPDTFCIVDEIPKDIGKVQFKYLKGSDKNEKIS
jgi:fatty-acyl-CoA synthase